MSKFSLPFLIVLLLLSLKAQAADWPQWGGSWSKNMVSEEKNLPDTFVPGEKETQGSGIKMETTKNVKWVAKLGSFSCGSPAVAGGKVFIGSLIDRKGVLNCFDEATGKLLWQWIMPCRMDKKDLPPPIGLHWISDEVGVCSTPVVDGDRLYFVDHNCCVVCLDVNGRPPLPGATVGQAETVWTFDMLKDENVGAVMCDASNCSPLIDGDVLYVATANGVDRRPSTPIAEDAARRCLAPNAPNLIALDKRSGRFVAKDAVPIVNNMLHGQWSSPSLGVVRGRKMVFFGGGDGMLYAFKALAKVPEEPVTLEPVWWLDCIPPEYRPSPEVDMLTEYCLGDRRRAGGKNKNIDGSFVGMSEIITTPVFYKDRVYVAIGRDPEHGRGRGALVCADARKSGDITKTGMIWTYQGLDRSLSTVSIADGLLYIGDVAGRLHCLDADSGEVRWVYESKSRMIGSTLVADGKIYMQTEKYLNILSAGKELKLLSQISLGAQSWVTPVAVNGTVYVGTRSYLWAVQQ